MKRLDPRDSAQLQAWTESLGRTRHAQIAIVTDLLFHANEDDMSEADRVFACATLELLERRGLH